jgi:hypothetical protein
MHPPCSVICWPICPRAITLAPFHWLQLPLFLVQSWVMWHVNETVSFKIITALCFKLTPGSYGEPPVNQGLVLYQTPAHLYQLRSRICGVVMCVRRGLGLSPDPFPRRLFHVLNSNTFIYIWFTNTNRWRVV